MADSKVKEYRVVAAGKTVDHTHTAAAGWLVLTNQLRYFVDTLKAVEHLGHIAAAWDMFADRIESNALAPWEVTGLVDCDVDGHLYGVVKDD